MGWLITAGSVLTYYAAALLTFRVAYAYQIEKVYKHRQSCRDCRWELDHYRRYSSGDTHCNWHRDDKSDIKERCVIMAITWPFVAVGMVFYYLGRGFVRLSKKLALPSGSVRTPSKSAWEEKVQEVRIEVQQKELEAQQRKLAQSTAKELETN